MLREESQVIVDNLLEYYIIENFISSDHLIAQIRNVGSDQDGSLDDAIIGGSLKSIKKEILNVELTDVIHQETQESLVHISRNELIEHSISFDF